MNFPYTTHNQKGVTCVDCHVNHVENTDRTAHTVPDHSFNASLNSCNTCHADQMHSASTSAINGTSAPVVEPAIVAATETPVTAEPEPVSPIGFSALAGLLGLAGGMVLAPWLERWYQRTIKSNREDEND